MIAAVARLGGAPGRKVRAPQGRVLGNAQAFVAFLSDRDTAARDGKWHRNTPSRPVGIRVKSDGKSVRSSTVTQRRLNPTWSKAK